MNKLTKTLTLSALTAALVGSFGFAQAQSGSTGNGATGNPDPNATLSGAPTPMPAEVDPSVHSRDKRVQDSNPGALNGEAADANAYDNTRPQPGFETTHEFRESPTKGESARSNNTRGHSRTTPQSEER